MTTAVNLAKWDASLDASRARTPRPSQARDRRAETLLRNEKRRRPPSFYWLLSRMSS